MEAVPSYYIICFFIFFFRFAVSGNLHLFAFVVLGIFGILLKSWEFYDSFERDPAPPSLAAPSSEGAGERETVEVFHHGGRSVNMPIYTNISVSPTFNQRYTSTATISVNVHHSTGGSCAGSANEPSPSNKLRPSVSWEPRDELSSDRLRDQHYYTECYDLQESKDPGKRLREAEEGSSDAYASTEETSYGRTPTQGLAKAREHNEATHSSMGAAVTEYSFIHETDGRSVPRRRRAEAGEDIDRQHFFGYHKLRRNQPCTFRVVPTVTSVTSESRARGGRGREQGDRPYLVHDDQHDQQNRIGSTKED